MYITKIDSDSIGSIYVIPSIPKTAVSWKAAPAGTNIGAYLSVHLLPPPIIACSGWWLHEQQKAYTQ
ncbi:MAG: hypothetical protein IPP29_21200 [Bacteroidetes bacterium]|nr:hypothetical protein [Bacteroidota bacterium]